MPFKTVLVIIQNEQDFDRVTGCAVSLAARFEGHLIGTHAETLPVAYASPLDMPDPEFIQVSTQMNRERTETLRGRFAEKLATEAVSHEWRSLETFSGDSAHSGIASARTCDLVVAAQADESGSADSPDIDALLYEAGRPVLVMPQEGACLSFFRRVIIAWNGSREAARAAFDALPFLLEADSVEVLVVGDIGETQSRAEAGADLAAALERHGVTVTVHAQAKTGGSTDSAIRNRLSETGADLLVLGAYSHSWLKEWLFGGVTSAMLKKLPVAAFLSR